MKLNSYLKIIVLALVYLIISLPIIFAEELNLQHDSVGNLVTGDGFYREYDGFNHLIRIKQGNFSSGNVTEEFVWHPIEERVFIKKIYWNNQTLRSTIKYLNKNTIKIKNESGTFYENYVYQDDILVAQVDANGNKQAVHNDHLGSVSLITNSSGDVIENEFFSPYGEHLTPILNSRFSFTGKEFDSITGQYDFMSRMTKPEWVNRFIQVDRMFYDFTQYDQERQTAYYDSQQLNPYTYARNNPYKYTDPTGHYIVQACLASSLCNQVVFYAQGFIRDYLSNPQSIARTIYQAPGKIERISNGIKDFVQYEEIDKENLPIGSMTDVPIEARKANEQLCEALGRQCEEETKPIKLDVKIDFNINLNIHTSKEAKEALEKMGSGSGGNPGGNFMFVTINGQTIYLTPGIPQSQQIPKTDKEKDKKENKPKT